MKKNKLSPRLWFNIITFGLMGQIAWNVENMYFNTFLYNSVYNGAGQEAISGNMSVMTAISLMVGFSAATAVITTFIMGTLSDKTNRRKIFISAGYIIWGIITGAFGFISRDNIASITGITDGTKILMLTVWTVIIMDCIMTFMGSTSNDSAFNAWVTDITEESNRPLVETVLAALPICATGIVLGLGVLVTKLGYAMFFIILGLLVSLCGVLGLFSLKDSLEGKSKNENYWAELFYGFRPSVIKANSRLYLVLSSMCIFGVSVQVFFPYLIIYLQHVILPENEELLSIKNIVLAIIAVFVLATGFVVLLKNNEKIGRSRVLLISSALLILGLTGLYFTKNIGAILLAAAPMGVGYAILTIMLNATLRDLTPPDRAGQFQGIRMIFNVLIPMVAGPAIGNFAINTSNITYINDYGVTTPVPSSLMFLSAAIVAFFVFIPLCILKKIGFKNTKSD